MTHNKNEAIARMQRRNKKSVCWTLKNETIRWRYIRATSARNWDGTPAGEGNDPNKEILEKMIHRNEQPPRFTNFW